MSAPELIGWREGPHGLEREDLFRRFPWTWGPGIEPHPHRLREHVEPGGPWNELSDLLQPIPQAVSLYVAKGEQVEEVWIVFRGDLDYNAFHAITEAVADVQLEYDFVTHTHIVPSESQLPPDTTFIYRKLR